MEKDLEARQYEILLSSKSTQGEWREEAPMGCSQYTPIYIFFYGQPHFSRCTTLAVNITLLGDSEDNVCGALDGATMGK